MRQLSHIEIGQFKWHLHLFIYTWCKEHYRYISTLSQNACRPQRYWYSILH